MGLEDAVRGIHDFESLLGLHRDELDWRIPAPATLEDATFEWTGDELRVSDRSAARLSGGVIRQLRPFTENPADQPWGVFFVEFAHGRVYRTALRNVLRGLVPNRKRDPSLPAWQHDNLLFICATKDYDSLTYAHFRGEDPKRAVLTTFGWARGDRHIRTLCEFNLERLKMPDNAQDGDAWLRQWRSAFDVQRVTDEFFKNYEACFYNEVRPAVRKMLGDEADAHDYTQLLLNRLMFCWFLQKKEWLGGSKDYLLELLERACRPIPPRKFLHDYLDFLFFEVLANPEERRRKRAPGDPHIVWEAPFLNGGLFERGRLDERVRDVPPLKRLPNTVFKAILEDLFSRYNFTVEESTSLDVQVALDPELLGTIFERLVTTRHETGSYYTPRPVVEFMCREALVHYLHAALPSSWRNRGAVIGEFVHDRNAGKISPADAPDIIRALDEVKVCDPACGSGAYLVTMLHELVSLYRLMYSEKLRDPKKDYDLKLRIIQRNVYGVDLDDFAVEIARLRLWLSLVVDNEETEVSKVEPLPNLDFKIEIGDSLTAPDPYPGEAQALRHDLVRQFQEKKAVYMRAHDTEKKRLRDEIERDRATIRSWLRHEVEGKALDWAVEFAEVFEPREAQPTIGGALNLGYELAPLPRPGGFDIVLTNPPYLRQEVVKRQFGDDYKKNLLRMYPDCFAGTADIYVAFYARAHELLTPDGVGCFISSNKWLRAAYGEKLRQRLLDDQAFHLVVDFGELPVFQAATFPGIFLWQKRPRGDAPTIWAVVKDLEACYQEGIREHVSRIAQTVHASQFGKGKARLATAKAADMRAKMEASGPRLGEVVKGRIYRGVLTGLNEAWVDGEGRVYAKDERRPPDARKVGVFIIDRATRDRLIAEDPKSAEIIKPLLVGDDVRRYETHVRENYLIWTYIGVPIKQYPAVLKHLKRFQGKAEKRWDKGEHWWELRACAYYDLFEKPKIIYPVIGKLSRFSVDLDGFLSNDKTFVIPSDDSYILGVLNSAHAFEYLKRTSSVLGDEMRGGRLEFRAVFMEALPIPDAPDADREAVAKRARECQELHMRRRRRVERFLRDIGLSPAQSSSRNPLEQPWTLTAEEFSRRAKGMPAKLFTDARNETAALTEQIERIEQEIDERVAGLYGL